MIIIKNYNLSGSCSAIAVLSTRGVEMVSMNNDIIDSETYLTVLEQEIIPLMNPFPSATSVLILDNAKLPFLSRSWCLS